jgi:hypothetical protein
MTAIVLLLSVSALGGLQSGDPGAGPQPFPRPATDWLLARESFPAVATTHADGRELTLGNGLVRRTWRLQPDAACVALDNLMTGASLLRAVRPEAELVLDGTRYPVGGLRGQPDHAWLAEGWLDTMTADPAAFRFVRWTSGPIEERFAWARTRHHAPDVAWPPSGVHLTLQFEAPQDSGLQGLDVLVHYELYDDIPLFAKWLELRNGTGRTVELDRFTSEVLAVVEHSSHVETRDVPLPHPDTLHVETDYAFGGFTPLTAMRHSVHWVPDPEFHTQVNYRKLNPCLLRVEPEVGPDVLIEPGGSFHSFRAWELVHDSTDRERRGLAQRQMMRTAAPWVTENPLIFHVVSSDPDVVRAAIDQAVMCGFEMVSLSFGSGLSMEDESPENLQRFADLADYALRSGIQLGGYSLLSSRRIQPDGDNCIHPDTGEPGGQTHGYCPALASHWGQEYFRKLRRFFTETGALQFTHDGSYPGDLDAAARPPLQRGADDSRWVQWRIISDFYQWLRARGAYVRVPDYYYLGGSNECGMGYREVNWSLPRAQQVIHTRQNIWDGTWEKTPSMGWMFVPLTQYHGGGAAATIEPLDEHIDHYERMLQSNLALGVQAVYRGTRLYDTPRVRDMVRGWTDWYRDHRDILESDLIHGRRADGRDLDWMLHVNPRLGTRGLLAVFNPLDKEVTRTLGVDLYYTGLEDTALVIDETGARRELALGRDHRIALEVTVPGNSMRWFRVE